MRRRDWVETRQLIQGEDYVEDADDAGDGSHTEDGDDNVAVEDDDDGNQA